MPCDPNGKLAFSSTQGNEMWVIALEKAWAKLHGCYTKMYGN